MVLGHEDFKTKEVIEDRFYPAKPEDRLAAFVIDFVIVFTLTKIIAAQSISFLRLANHFGFYTTFYANILNILWIGYCVYLSYLIITYKFLGTTIGFNFFQLRILDINTNKTIDFTTLLQRSLFSYFSFYLLFPFFSIFTNKLSRTYYDKICDTFVVTQNLQKSNRLRTDKYNKLIGSVLVLFIFSIFSLSTVYLTKNSFRFTSDYKNSSKVCESLTDFHSKWSISGAEESRLEVALALYSAGELSVVCLEKEIEFEFSINPKSSTALFAKGLLSFENDEKVIQYFKKSCQMDYGSHACEVATWISQWPNFFEEETIEFNARDPKFKQIWLIKRLHQKGMIDLLESFLNQFKVTNGLEGFYVEHLMRVELHKKDYKNFDSVLKVAKNTGSRERVLEEEFCGSLISDSCNTYETNKICKNLVLTRKSDKHLLNMSYACQGKPDKIFASDLKIENFYKNLANQEDFILDDLKSIFMDSKNPMMLRSATLNVLLDKIRNPEFLISLKEEWESSGSRDYFWRIWGEKLKLKFKNFGDTQSTYQVFKDLSNEFKQDQFDFNIDEPTTLQRIPASVEPVKKRKRGM